MRISVFRKAHFNAAHRLFVPQWSDEQNEATFGPCNNPFFHGHNYELIVRVTGEVDPVTGYLIDLVVLKKMIQEHVLDYLDHKNLNMQIPEFASINPTAENICHLIWKILRAQLDEKFDLSVRLYETPRNFVEFPALD